jgi:hypothetical protein
MTTTTHEATRSAGAVIGTDLLRTARTTGLLYLGFFIAGILGSIVVRSQLFNSESPQSTWTNLTQHEALARVGIALELAIVLAQALTAVWFYPCSAASTPSPPAR